MSGHRARRADRLPLCSKVPRLLSRKSRRDLSLMLGVTLLFWLAAQLGLVFNDNGYLTPVWPPAAVACVAGILYGWPSLIGAAVYIVYDFVADGQGHAFSHDRWAFVEPLSMLAAAAMVRWTSGRLGVDGRLETVRAVLVMMALGVLFAVVNGAGATAGYCGLAGTPRCIEYGWSGYWIQSMIGDVFGCLICMPALLSWARWIDARLGPRERRVPASRFPERRRSPREPRPAVERGPEASDSRLPRVLQLSREQGLFIFTSLAASLLGWAVTRGWNVPVHVVGFLALPLQIGRAHV